MSVSKTKLAQEGTDAGESLRASARSHTESGGGKHRLCDPPTMGVNVMPGRDGDTTTNAEPYSDSDNSRPAGSKMVKGRPRGQSIGLSMGHCEDNRFVALAVDDSDVDLGTGLGCSNSGHSAVGGRKQTPSPTFVAGLIGSDTDAEGSALAKVKTARKGKARGTTAGPSRDRFLKPARVRPGDTTTDNESDVGTPLDDLCALNAQELRAYAGVRLTNILEIARKSGDLKFIARIKRLTTSLSELVDALASRSEAEEKRLLRAENRRLELEIEAFKSEAKALRRGIAEAKMEAAATASAAGPPATLLTIDDVEQLKFSLMRTLGEMINVRLAAIEDRLLPAPSMRLPLGAGAGSPPRTTAASVAVEASAASPVTPTVAVQKELLETVVKKGKKGKGKGKLDVEFAREVAIVQRWVRGRDAEGSSVDEPDASVDEPDATPKVVRHPWSPEIAELRAASIAARRAYLRYRRRKNKDPTLEAELQAAYSTANEALKLAISQGKDAA